MEQRGNYHPLSGTRSAPLFLLTLMLATAISFPLSQAQGASVPSPVKEQPRPATAAPHANATLADLDSLSWAAEEIFNLAQGGKLDRTGKKLDALKKNVAAISHIQDEANNSVLPRLGRTIAELELAITAKDRLDTMRYANRITLLAATVAVPSKSSIPMEVSFLDYNGRELEILSEVKKTEKLSGVVIRMHLAWQTLMPKLIEHNCRKELKRFSEIMGHLESARSPEEYGHLSRQVQAETDVMKALFARPPK